MLISNPYLLLIILIVLFEGISIPPPQYSDIPDFDKTDVGVKLFSEIYILKENHLFLIQYQLENFGDPE